jgi:hypothetical protein
MARPRLLNLVVGPGSSPTKIADEVVQRALGVRAALESSGVDHGPISVHDKMRALALDPVPSVASLARVFRLAGVARLEPRKNPRSAWRRFVYPAPNACWQLDATEYVLTGPRRSPASRTSRPPKARTNASTRHCSAVSTSSRWPTAWTPCRHRSTRSAGSTTPIARVKDCPGRVTPQAAWDATTKADPPRPQADRPRREPPVAPAFRRPRVQQPPELPAGNLMKKLSPLRAVSAWIRSPTYTVKSSSSTSDPRPE